MNNPFTSFSLSNINGEITIDDQSMNIVITNESVSAYFSYKNVQSVNITINRSTRTPNITISGASELSPVTSFIIKVVDKLNTILDEVTI